MIVVDTNIIAYLYLTSAYTKQVERLLTIDPEWATTILWRSEFRNILTLYLRKKLLTLQEAALISEEAETLMQKGEYQVTSAQVLHLVTISDCSAYDCEFVAVAEDFHLPLVTVDKKVLNAFPHIAVSLESFTK